MTLSSLFVSQRYVYSKEKKLNTETKNKISEQQEYNEHLLVNEFYYTLEHIYPNEINTYIKLFQKKEFKNDNKEIIEEYKCPHYYTLNGQIPPLKMKAPETAKKLMELNLSANTLLTRNGLDQVKLTIDQITQALEEKAQRIELYRRGNRVLEISCNSSGCKENIDLEEIEDDAFSNFKDTNQANYDFPVNSIGNKTFIGAFATKTLGCVDCHDFKSNTSFPPEISCHIETKVNLSKEKLETFKEANDRGAFKEYSEWISYKNNELILIGLISKEKKNEIIKDASKYFDDKKEKKNLKDIVEFLYAQSLIHALEEFKIVTPDNDKLYFVIIVTSRPTGW